MMDLPCYDFGPSIPNTVQSTMPLHFPNDVQEEITSMNGLYTAAMEKIHQQMLARHRPEGQEQRDDTG